MLDSGLKSPENRDVLSVSALNRRVSGVLEQQFPLLWVQGEVSNFVAAASGHWYFSLKDALAQVRVVMFRQRASLSDFTPRNGDQIQVRCKVTFYEPRGDFQLGAESIRRAGAGDLFAQFERLKRLLQSQGLFEAERKRAIPEQVRRVAVVTSSKGAALRDVLATLNTRAPNVEVFIVPALVQGAEAPQSLLKALELAKVLHQHHPIDVLLLVRGGGAMEDLWAFNDEMLARAIAAFPVPVISGVGHETDFTIADFVADLRAATPTAAAIAAVPDQSQYQEHLKRAALTLQAEFQSLLDRQWQRLDFAIRLLRSPQEQLAQQTNRLEQLQQRLTRSFQTEFSRNFNRVDHAQARLRRPSTVGARAQLAQLQARLTREAQQQLVARRKRLEALAENCRLVSPQAVLDRGFALITNEQGVLIRDSKQTTKGQALKLSLRQGALIAIVDQQIPEQSKG
jgi:exodeoxyribonuclease VII large subunit